MELAETLTSIKIMEEISLDTYPKAEASSNSVPLPATDNTDPNPSSLRENLCITSEMALAGTVTSCTLLFKLSSDEGGLTKNGTTRVNFLKYLRAPMQITNKKDKEDAFMAAQTQSTWRQRQTSRSFYQKNLDRKLSTPREYDDPYKQLRSTFASSMRSSSRV